MTEPAPLTERAVWQVAGGIVEKHGARAAGYIIQQLRRVLDQPIAVEDWRRVAAAIDAITGGEEGHC